MLNPVALAEGQVALEALGRGAVRWCLSPGGSDMALVRERAAALRALLAMDDTRLRVRLVERFIGQ